jgi:hypothetical protein
MQAFAKAASEETLLAKRLALANLEERAAETEVKMITTENDRVKLVFERPLNKQRSHISEIEREGDRGGNRTISNKCRGRRQYE